MSESLDHGVEASRRNPLGWGAIALLVLIGLLVYPLRAQEASRLALTASIYERGSVAVDGYPIGIDRAVREGRTYSDKGPGQPIMALPVYALAVEAGLPSASEFQEHGNLTLWLVTFASSTLPAIALFFVMSSLARPVGKHSSRLAAASLATGTLLLPFSTILFGHVLSALLVAASFLFIQRGSPRHLWVSGFMAGLAVTVEYTTAIAAAVLVVWTFVEYRRRVVWFIFGGLGPAVGLAIYNTVAFGSPWTLSYQYSAFDAVPESAAALTGIFSWGGTDNLMAFLFSGRGLLIATPIVLIGVVGTVLLARTSDMRRSYVVILVIFGLFSLLPIFWGNPWGGESPGARYMTPALPLLALGLAQMWRRFRLLTFGVWLISAFTMTVATLTDALILGRDHPGGLSVWARMALNGDWMPNLFGVIWGRVGDVLFVVSAAGALVLISTTMVVTQRRASRESIAEVS